MDPFTLMLILGLATTVAGTATGITDAVLSAQGQKNANAMNKDIHAQDLAFNSAEAQKDRDFQLYMSNTAHQREVADLKNAGLNPWLSVSGSGASSGVQSSSAQASSSTSMKSEAPDLSGIASALSSVKDIALISALTKKR